jgi:cytochrome c6
MPPEARRRARHGLVLAFAGALSGCSSGASAPGASTPGASTPGASTPPERASADLYTANCVACHQQDAHGIPGVYPSLVGSPVVLGDPAQFALWVVKGRRPGSMPAGRYATTMPQFGWMRDTDVAALQTYLRAHFGNGAPSVPPSAVSQALEE